MNKSEPLMFENFGANRIELYQIADDRFRVQASGIYSNRVCGEIVNGLQNAINKFHYKCGLLWTDINGFDDE